MRDTPFLIDLYEAMRPEESGRGSVENLPSVEKSADNWSVRNAG